MLGIFVPFLSADAQEKGACIRSTGRVEDVAQIDCPTVNSGGYTQNWMAYDASNPALTPPPKTDNNLYGKLDECGFAGIGGTIVGCVEVVTYFMFVAVPSYLLVIAANVFNFSTALSVSSRMYELPFIQTIWTIVRDFANIFFILILLYAAFEIILGMGHGGGKKIVATVILIALVVNFSLFFTKIIIDSSNVVALIFYNRIDTSNVLSYDKISDEAKTGVAEKDMAGALVSRFNVNQFFNETTFAALGKVNIEGKQVDVGNWGVNAFLLTSTMILYGIIIFALIYAFFVAGMSFLGRMMNLMMLLIISPLAFVTYSVPSLSHINTIGFGSWMKKLLESSFVAAIFMFIIYIASEVLRADIFKSAADAAATNQSFVSILIMIFMPAILIVILLLKGAAYAKKASGEFTGAAIGGAKALGVLALGGAALGTAVVGRKTVGSVAKSVQSSDATRWNAMSFKDTRQKWSTMNKANPFAYLGLAGTAIGGVGKATSAAAAATIHAIPGTGGKTLGTHLQEQEKSLGKKKHSEHTLDAEASKYAEKNGMADAKEVKYGDLTEPQQLEVRKEIDKNVLAKESYGVSLNDVKDDTDRKNIITIIDNAYAAYARDLLAGISESAAKINLKSASTITKDNADNMTTHTKTNPLMGELSQLARRGSYDVRSLPELSLKTKGITKLTVGILAATAAGIRMGLKSNAGVDPGKGQKDFLQDLKGTISTALGNLKINVNTGGSHGGGAKSSGGSHGGEGGHH